MKPARWGQNKPTRWGQFRLTNSDLRAALVVYLGY
jgi:hypothetical protein